MTSARALERKNIEGFHLRTLQVNKEKDETERKEGNNDEYSKIKAQFNLKQKFDVNYADF